MTRKHLWVIGSVLVFTLQGFIPSMCTARDLHGPISSAPAPGSISRPFDHLMSSVRESFNRNNLLIASGIIILIGGDTGRAAAESYLKAAIVSELIVGSLKLTVNRPRPAGSHSRINSSFPSSHAAMSFAIASSIGRSFPRVRIPAYALASLVAYSRVYYKRHHLTDVVAGALAGVAGAELSERYLKDVHFGTARIKSRPAFRVDQEWPNGTTLRAYLSTSF